MSDEAERPVSEPRSELRRQLHVNDCCPICSQKPGIEARVERVEQRLAEVEQALKVTVEFRDWLKFMPILAWEGSAERWRKFNEALNAAALSESETSDG
jgi:hypothetical protein